MVKRHEDAERLSNYIEKDMQGTPVKPGVSKKARTIIPKKEFSSSENN